MSVSPLNPTGYLTAAAATAAEAALALAQLSPTDRADVEIELSVIDAAIADNPYDAVLLIHDAAEDLNVARIAEDRTEMLRALCAIQAAGYRVTRHILDEAASQHGGDVATVINAARSGR